MLPSPCTPTVLRSWSIVCDRQPLEAPGKSDLHRRQLYSLHACLQGRLSALSEDGSALSVGPGGVLLLEPGDSFTCHHHSRAIVVAFALVLPSRKPWDDRGRIAIRSLLQPPLQTIFGTVLPAVLPADDCAEATALIHDLHRTTWFPVSCLAADAALYSWLTAYAARHRRPPALATAPFAEQVDALYRLHLGDGYGLDELAARLGVSRRTLIDRYRNERGMPPGAALQQLKLHRAFASLRRGRSIADTASDCGFLAASAFSRWFRQRTGTTPSAWREREHGH